MATTSSSTLGGVRVPACRWRPATREKAHARTHGRAHARSAPEPWAGVVRLLLESAQDEWKSFTSLSMLRTVSQKADESVCEK